MSVVSVTEIFVNRGGSTGEKDSDTRVFRVVTDNGRDNKYIVLNSGMVPLRGHSHNTQSNLTCKNVDCQQDSSLKSPKHWIVKAEYDNQPMGALPQNQSINPDPLKRAVEIEGQTIVGKKARTHGYLIADRTMFSWAGGVGLKVPTNITAIESTAKEAIEGLEEDDIQEIIQVTINALQIQTWIQDYQGAINNKDVRINGYQKIYPKWSLRVVGFRHSKPLTEKLPNGIETVTYYQTQFGLHYKKGLWVTPVRNQGFYQLREKQQKLILINGARPQAKVPLDGDGKKLDEPTADNVLYRWYADGPEVNFDVFGLNNPQLAFA